MPYTLLKVEPAQKFSLIKKAIPLTLTPALCKLYKEQSQGLTGGHLSDECVTHELKF